MLFLTEGDPESLSSSGSGTPRSLLEALREAGASIVGGDVEPSGLTRYMLAASLFARQRQRWRARFHMSGRGFRKRSAIATRLVTHHNAEVVLQYGATFLPNLSPSQRLFVYSDANIVMAMQHQQSWAKHLTPEECSLAIANERRVYQRATALLCFSEHVRRSMLADFEVTPSRAIVVGAGANLPPVDLAMADRPDGLRHPEPTILFVGREFERKGGPTLLAAFRKVRLAVPNARLVVIGPPPQSSEEGVSYLGYLSKDVEVDRSAIRTAFLEAHIFCLPTEYEPFGIALVEAMHFGLPVVATDAWAIPEIVEAGHTGLLVPAGDAPRLAEALTRLLKEPHASRLMGQRGRERAREYFAWDRVARRILEITRHTSS